MFPLTDMKNVVVYALHRSGKLLFFLGHRHSTPAVLPNSGTRGYDTDSGLSSLSTCTRERLFIPDAENNLLKTRTKHGSRLGYDADISHFFVRGEKSLCCMFENGGFEEAFEYL